AALGALAGPAGVDVVVSLPWEAGREAFRATARTHAELSGLAGEEVELPALADHYAPESRAALHRLERELFEDDPGRAESGGDVAGIDPASGNDASRVENGGNAAETCPRELGGAVRMHLAGGRRAEIELCAAEVLALLRDGTAPGDVAVVLRDPRPYAS